MTETKPHRVRLSRAKGWRKPENTVVVSRPSRFGNPFKITHEECDVMDDNGMCWVVRHESGRPAYAHEATQPEARQVAVHEFRLWLISGRPVRGLVAVSVDEVRAELAGKNLACWCPLDQPCHADVLLEIANGADHDA